MPKDLRQMAEADLAVREKHFIAQHGRLFTAEELGVRSLNSYDKDTIVLRHMLEDPKFGVGVTCRRNENV